MLNIPYALPLIEEEEIKEVVDTLQSNWLSRGPKTAQFENEFAAFVNSKEAVGLNSCTAGLHIAQLVAGVRAGDEVITTPYTFVATVNTIIHSGAKPVFVDIDPITMNLNHKQLESKISKSTKAIIPVHFAGYPCEMDEIMDIAKKYRLVVIEDAAHAVYTQYKGKMIGSIGDFSCFSFYATKNLVTGEGGMVTTNNSEWADELRMLSLHGMNKNAWNRYSDKGSWFYEVLYAGFKYNMTDMQAALGIIQLRRLEDMQQKRTEYAKMYNAAFSDLEGFIAPYDNEIHRHAWHLYVIRLQENYLTINRDQFIEQLKERGIGTSVHFIPVHFHPFYQRLGYRIGEYPMTETCYEQAVSLPLNPKMSSEDIHTVITEVYDIVYKYKR
jgi:dTDP-4-amino-4,6-dideoxygalactose transaminase